MRRFSPSFQRWLPALAVALSLLVAWQAAWPGAIEATDQAQSRLDVPAPVPCPNSTVMQSFVAQHDGLTAVELLLAVYPRDEGDEPATLTVRLVDDGGREVYAGSWPNDALVHNEPLRLSFPPEARSNGRQYRLILEGTGANRATVWSYSLKGYAQGTLQVGAEAQVGSLRFETVYRYQAGSALSDLWQALAGHAWVYPAFAAMLLLPGLALVAGPWAAVRDPAALLGAALAGSLVVVPLAWLWWTWLGLRVSAPLVVLGLVGAAVLGVRRWRASHWRASAETWALALVLAAGLAVRLLAVRDVVVPGWVDSPQHVLISRIMAETGGVPSGYRPWMPVDVFVYHFGFHALIASLLQLADGRAVELILFGGQLLNALAPMAVYSATYLLTNRRRAALVAAFFVALLSLFPSYYVTWGRYTQLSGLLVLAPLMGLAYRFFRSVEPWGSTDRWRKASVVGLLAGGLFLVHARVWVFALVWLPVAAGGAWLAGPPTWRRARAILGGLVGVNLLGVAAVAPWHVRVVREFLLTLGGQAGESGGRGAYNRLPWEYMSYGWERVWFGLAAGGLLVAIGWWGWALVRGRRAKGTEKAGVVVMIGAWIAAVGALINVDRLGVPTFGLVNNNSWVISLFVPVGIVIGWLVDQAIRLASRRRWVQVLARSAVAVAVVGSGLYGVRQNIAIVNPETVLAVSDDLALIERSESLVPVDGLVLVNGWVWLGKANWAGSDAGYWILPLTGRQTTMPPIGYGMDRRNFELVNSFNAALAAVEDWGAAETLDLLHRRGVTHIFVGARGGAIRPELLVGEPAYELLDTNGAAWLFAVRYDVPS